MGQDSQQLCQSCLFLDFRYRYHEYCQNYEFCLLYVRVYLHCVFKTSVSLALLAAHEDLL